MGGVGECILPCSLIAMRTWEVFCSIATWEVRWKKHLYNSNHLAMLLPGSIATPMGGCGNGTFLQANMGAMHYYHGLWEKHLSHSSHVAMLLPWEECIATMFACCSTPPMFACRNVPTSEHGR